MDYIVFEPGDFVRLTGEGRAALLVALAKNIAALLHDGDTYYVTGVSDVPARKVQELGHPQYVHTVLGRALSGAHFEKVLVPRYEVGKRVRFKPDVLKSDYGKWLMENLGSTDPAQSYLVIAVENIESVAALASMEHPQRITIRTPLGEERPFRGDHFDPA